MAVQLNEDYFQRVRGDQEQIRASARNLVPEMQYCSYCRRKTAVIYKPNTNFGGRMVVQVVCPKCHREIVSSVSYRRISYRRAS